MTNMKIIALAAAENGISADVQCHTYAHWKDLGFQVKKGEKAKFSAMIWKPFVKKEAKELEETAENIRMFMKKASFFTDEQVERIGE